MDPDWQGDDYSFLGISRCWDRLGVKTFDDFRTWRANYPVTVAVLDTGIMKDHEAFKHLRVAGDKIIQGKNCIQNQSGQDIADGRGHGTQCAAIIAGGEFKAVPIEMSSTKKSKQRKNEFSFWNGVAPFVNLYICKIDNKVSSIIAAVNHLIKEKNGKRLQVDIISLSIGTEEYDADLEKCIQEASLNNIIVVCAASNEGRRSSNSILYPARLGHVICVGSHNYLGRESSFTGVGREIDILGPGELRSARPLRGKPQVKNAVAEAKGTSFAAPYVAGIVAIILANAQRIGGPDVRNAISNNVVMKQILREMASEPGDHTQSRGHGSLDPLRIFGFSESDGFFRQILESITSLAPPPEPDENHTCTLQNYDLRKVASKFIPEDLHHAGEVAVGKREVKHVTHPMKVLEDVMFSSRMESINLSLPNVSNLQSPQVDYGEYMIHTVLCQCIEERRSLDLEVFYEKIKREVRDSEISCLSLPSPLDAAYGDMKGLAALQEFLTQLGGDCVSSVKDLWLEGGEDKLKFSDIKKILQTLQGLKSADHDSSRLKVHCEKVDFVNVAADSQIPNVENVDVIIHQRDPDVSRIPSLKIPDNVTIEECTPECRPHCSSVSKQTASCNQVGVEDMACDIISLEKLASRDGAAALHATMRKRKRMLKGDVHVTVAVLGSGVYVDHQDITKVIQDKACFVPQESWDLSVDTRGTGTALSSIATLFAPLKPGQTHLLVAKVINEHGRSNPAWVAKAVDWAANHSSYPADVILIPVGFEKFNPSLYEAVTKAQKDGKIVIVAAAHSTEAQEISYPARHGDVICVGSHSSSSVKGREMDFLVLGEKHPVKAASAKGTDMYKSVSGTSVAAAMATAVVGFTLMYAESVGGEDLRDNLKSNTMMRELLREACSSRGFHTPDRGYGTLDPDRLFKWGSQHFSDLVMKIAGT